MSEYIISKLKETEYHDWDVFVDKSPQGTVFNKSIWLKNMVRIFGGSVNIIVCIKDKEIVAGCALYYNKNKILPPIFTPFNGFLLYKSHSEQILKSLISSIEKESKNIILIHSPQFKDEKVFLQEGWDVITRNTYYLPLDDFKKIENRISRNPKRMIKKANDIGVKILPVDINEKNINILYDLWKLSFQRQNLNIPISSNKFSEIFEFLNENNLCKLYFAYYKNKVISGRAEILSNKIVFDFVAGSNPDYLKTGATTLLVWEMLKDLSGKYLIFDFVGADVPSIASFKSRFGGQLVSHYMTRKLDNISKLKKIVKKRFKS